MARLHYDLHYIPSDLVPLALELLIHHGYITRSEKDIHHHDIRSRKDSYPACGGALIEIVSYY